MKRKKNYLICRLYSESIKLTLLLIICFFVVSSCGKKNDQKNDDEEKSTDTWETFERDPNAVDYPIEVFDYGEVDCKGERCLIIEESSEYCSVDLINYDKVDFFKYKSRIKIEAGVYALNQVDNTLPDIPITVKTPYGEAQLLPEGPLQYEHLPYLGYPYYRQETIATIKESTRYVSEQLNLYDFRLSVTHIGGIYWPDDHFRLGDPNDVWWWYGAVRRISFKPEGEPELFPELNDTKLVMFAPCDLAEQEDDEILFEFETGEALSLVLRSFTHSSGTGDYLVRLMSAKGDFMNKSVNVDSFWDLAAYGSRQVGARVLPPLIAVRWESQVEPCGVIFDSIDSALETSPHIFRAFQLSCNGELGEEVSLKNVSFVNFSDDKYIY